MGNVEEMGNWGLGIGNWELGIGNWELGIEVSLAAGASAMRDTSNTPKASVPSFRTTTPHSPFPIPHSPFPRETGLVLAATDFLSSGTCLFTRLSRLLLWAESCASSTRKEALVKLPPL
jgi:hypothetical protein